MRVAMASGTAQVVKLSATDRSLSLMGPLGDTHNLVVVKPSGDDRFPALHGGDLVDFCLIQLVTVGIDRVSSQAPQQVSRRHNRFCMALLIAALA